MTTRIHRGRLVALALVAASLGLAACGSNQAAEKDKTADGAQKKAAAMQRVAVNVETKQVQPETFDDVIEVVGTVKPEEDIMVASEESGKVARWLVAKGSYVKAGQPLVKLDDDMLRSQLAQAQAQLNIAKVNADKNQQVYTDAGAVAEVAVTTAKYNVDAAQAQVDLLKTRIAKTTITAPVSGRIDDRLIDIGEMVPPGGPVARLIQAGTVKVSAGVPERYVEGLRVGLPVEMTFDALGGRKVSGKITYVGSMISQNDRTLPIEIAMPNRDNAFAPEMVANLRIIRDVLHDVLVVPRTAAVRVEDGFQIYVAERQGSDGYVATARPVTLGASDHGGVVVESGLKPGDRIITVGQQKINPGEAVTFE